MSKEMRHMIDNFKRLLTETEEKKEEKLHATPQELIRNLPNELKKLLFNQWGAKQNPKWHPEIRRILRELYSPDGEIVKPKKIVIHKSEKENRKSIEKNGLIPKVGDCYKTYAGKTKCRPAIFATNSKNPKQWFAKDWDGDVWAIDTSMIPNVVWYEDIHLFPDGQNKHIITFDKIPPHALTLLQKGTE